MKKKYLFLGLALLLCGGSAWAQTTPGAISSYEDLKQAVTNIENVATLETQLTSLTTQIESWNLKKPLQYTYETVEEGNNVYQAINAYTTVHKAYLANPTEYNENNYTNECQAEISYRTVTLEDVIEGTTFNTLYISTPAVSNNDKSNEWKTFKVGDAIKALQSNNTQEINKYKIITSGTINALIFVYNPVDTEGNYITNTLSETFTKGMEGTNFLSRTTVAKLETGIQDNDLRIKKTIQKVNPEYTDWETEYNRLTNLKTQTEASLQEASSVKTYTITKDITVTDKELNEKTWPATYTLNGDCYHISLNNQSDALFAANAGTIKNLISTDGSIAVRNTGDGYVDNCIFKATDGTYRVYTENARTNFNNIETAIYSKRNSFGYNLTNSEATKVTDTNKLYSASYASAAKKTKQSFYVNINGNSITDGNNLTSYSTKNAFIYVEDEVPATTIIETENVVANGVCQNAKIVEGKDEPEFYIPTNFTAANLNYDRDLKTDVVSVCLPFALTDDIKNTINENLKKDGSNNEMYYYNYKRVNKTTKTVWFGRLSEIKANTPGVLAFTTKCIPGKIFNGLTNVNFVSTEGADLALTATDDVDDQAKRFRGNYKPYQQVADVVQAAGNIGSDVYSFKDNVLVKLNEKARINQFRSFIVYTMDLTQEANLRVRFMDEEGNEVTHIENVNTDRKENSEFKVSGSNGAIEISAEKACDVKVYTTGGALVKAVRVEAGHTSLPVNAGMYIVNKNKVVVK